MSWQSHRVSELTQIWSLTQSLTLVFDLISMCQFIMTAYVKNIEVFSIILKKINVFLNLESILSSSLNSDESKSRCTTLTVCSKNSLTLAQFSSRFQDSTYDKNHHLNLHQIKKKFHLIAFTTQEDLEVY